MGDCFGRETGRPKEEEEEAGGGGSAGTKRSRPGVLSLSHDHSSMPVATTREQTEPSRDAGW